MLLTLDSQQPVVFHGDGPQVGSTRLALKPGEGEVSVGACYVSI